MGLGVDLSEAGGVIRLRRLCQSRNASNRSLGAAMAWTIKPMEVLDEFGRASGRYRMVALDEDDPLGLPHGVLSHDHSSVEQAESCEVCDEYVKHMAGQLSRTEEMWKQREADLRAELGYPVAGDTYD